MEKLVINKELYCQFLIASQSRHSMVGLSELFDNHPAHDSYTRWLNSVRLTPRIIWEYSKDMVKLDQGYLIVDDSVLDKWYGPNIECVKTQYSGLHHRKVKGIGVVNFIWNGTKEPESAQHVPIDYRVYDIRRDGKTKNQHCHDMLESAYQRGFKQATVLMDSAYSDLGTLKQIRRYEWTFVTGMKSNRIVSFRPHEYHHISEIATEAGIICHLRGFGFIKAIKLVRSNGDIDYLATNDTSLSSSVIRLANDRRWKIEEFHRGEKQTVGVEKCQSRKQRAQRNHILCSNLAFLAIEKHRLEYGCSWQASKFRVIADALRAYLRKPFVPLPINALTY